MLQHLLNDNVVVLGAEVNLLLLVGSFLKQTRGTVTVGVWRLARAVLILPMLWAFSPLHHVVCPSQTKLTRGS